jgi:hypothetical protein
VPEQPGTATASQSPLNGWWRTIIVILGFGALGAGGLAVFITHLEAGPVALLAIGFLFLIIGIGGRLPNRLKVGENEAEWNAVAQAFQDVVRVVPPEKFPVVEDAVKDIAAASPSLARNVQRRVAVEMVLLSRLHYWAERLGLTYGEQVRLPTGAQSDAIVIGSNGRKLWVIAERDEVKPWELEGAKSVLLNAKEVDPSFVGMLIIAPAGPETWRTVETSAGTIYIATIRKGEESEEIRVALERSFEHGS